MHKYEVLRHCAEEFRLQLEKDAKEDAEHKSELEWFICCIPDDRMDVS